MWQHPYTLYGCVPQRSLLRRFQLRLFTWTQRDTRCFQGFGALDGDGAALAFTWQHGSIVAFTAVTEFSVKLIVSLERSQVCYV